MSAVQVSERVGLRREGTTACLTIGVGKRHNALRTADWRSIADTVEWLRADDDLQVLVISGSGSSFCAGSDLTEWANATPVQVDESFLAMEAACAAIESLPIPALALIRGVAAGAGCQLALACDLRMMAESAVIGMPILRLGILVSREFAHRILVLAGPQRARELLYTGRLLDADTAHRFGLVNIVSRDAELSTIAETLVGDIVRQPLTAIRAAKAVTRIQDNATVRDRHIAEGAVSWPTFRKSVSRFLADHDEPSRSEVPVERD